MGGADCPFVTVSHHEERNLPLDKVRKIRDQVRTRVRELAE